MPTRSEINAKTDYYWERIQKHGKQYSNFNWPHTELILNLIYTYDILMTCSAKLLSDFGLSVSAVNILIILKYNEDAGCKQQELCHLLVVSRANIAKVIDGLEKRGLVRRSGSELDRRARIVKLTEEGIVLIQKYLPQQYDLQARILAGLSKKDITHLSKLLAKFRNSIVESGTLS